MQKKKKEKNEREIEIKAKKKKEWKKELGINLKENRILKNNEEAEYLFR